MPNELAAMTRKLLAENYRDGVRAIEFFSLDIIVSPPESDVARAIMHIAKSNASTNAARTKMIHSLLRKLRRAVCNMERRCRLLVA